MDEGKLRMHPLPVINGRHQWAMRQCVSAEGNGLIEVLHYLELLVPSREMDYEIVQGLWPIWVP